MHNLPIILIEVVLVFGGVLAFGWWQLRELALERARREQRQAADSANNANIAHTGETGPASEGLNTAAALPHKDAPPVPNPPLT